MSAAHATTVQTAADLAPIYVEKLGLKLVPLPPRSKRPVTDDWGNNLLETPEQAREYFLRNPNANMGVALGPSRVCSFDVDDIDATKLIFEEFGWSIDELLETFPTIQGRSDGFRLLFRIPEGESLKYHSLTWPKQDGSRGRFTVWEMRAADGEQRQDVLPPSIHPETNEPYKWLKKPQSGVGLLPPPDFLLQIWNNWDALKPQLQAVCPWLEKPKVQARPRPQQQASQGGSVIDAYNAAHSIDEALLRYGYKQQGRRFLSPHSKTRLPGVTVWAEENKCFIHHASDPLCSTDNNQPAAPFDLFCQYEHGGDVRAAVKAAGTELGMKFEPKPRREDVPRPTPAGIDPETGEIIESTASAPAAAARTAPAAANDNDALDIDPYSPGRLSAFFTILGYDREDIYFFQHETRQMLVMSRKDMSQTALLSLAPGFAWEARFNPDGRLKRFNKDDAVDALFRAARKRNVFNPARIRGRGAWTDAGRHIFHFGDRLLSDGSTVEIGRLDSRFIYQAEVPLEIEESAQALTDDEGENLLYVATQFRWNMPASAALLAGWVALAPLCGALRWRPHVWLTGGAGCGKSTILESFVNRLTRWCNVYAQGNSTEAGIRQTLGCDAVPVLFDEGEKNNDRERQRMDSVLALIRQASSESGAKTLKGTTTGSAMNFHIRSMFCLASIQVGIEQQADRERLTVLTLKSKPIKGSPEEEQSAKQWKQVKDLLYAIERDEKIADRLFNRMIGMLPQVLAAVEVFATAAAKHFGNQRAGDQYGTLMAGCWCLMYRTAPTEQDALDMIEKFDWNEHTDTGHLDDAGRALVALLEARIRTSSGTEFSVFELVDCIAYASGVERSGRDPDERPACFLEVKDAQAALQRHGMKVHQGKLMLSNTSESLVKLVAGTSFQADFRGLISRNPGVMKNAGVVWMNGAASRCIGIPLEAII